MRVLVKYGGTRIGDMFHCIPLLKELQRLEHEVDLAHGSYEKGAAQLLLHLGLVKSLHSNPFIDGNINTDMGSIVRFVNSIVDIYEKRVEYDCIIEPERQEGEDPFGQRGLTGGWMQTGEDCGVNFGPVPWAVTDVPDVTVGDWKAEVTEYIGVQPASISGFKTYNPLYAIEYPSDVKSFGFMSDGPIVDSIAIHGHTMIDVYEELLTCSMMVSTHSSIGVLAYYLGIPQIFIHFWPTGLANLAERGGNVVNIREPGKIELQIAIDEMYNKLKGVMNE